MSTSPWKRVSVDYPGRPRHRAHTVEVQPWGDQHVMLVLMSDTRVVETLLSREQLEQVFETAKTEMGRGG